MKTITIPMTCPKCGSDDVDIIRKYKQIVWIACYNCNKGSYLWLIGAKKPTRTITIDIGE